jgi:putative tricarboxylic transport membrane protein
MTLPMVHNAYRIGALTVVSGAALAVIGALQLSLGTPSQPMPGLWPFIVALIVGCCGLVLLWADSAEDYEPWTRKSAKVAVGFIALAVFIPALQVLGFIPAAFLLLLFWIRGLCAEPTRLSISLSLVGSVVIYLTFAKFLEVPLPSGLLYNLTGLEIGL